MKIVETRLLRGPNIHSMRPAFLAVLDLQELDGVSSLAVAQFVDRLLALIPTLSEHRCSVGRRGGFVERLRQGTYMAHIVEHVLLELQCLAGPEVGFGRARMDKSRPGHYRVVCSYAIEPLVVAALPLAVELVETLARGGEFASLQARLKELREIAGRAALGPSTRAIVEAAQQRGIPVMRLSDEASLFQLGWGARAQRIRATITGQTNFLAVDLASDKHLTKQLLGEAGLPVPRGEVVRTVQDAVRVARRIGRPVAIKPLDANQGKGVTVDVQGEQAVSAAFERAREWGRRIIVEEFIQGDDHRVLVVGGRVVAASHRRPPSVTGDGQHTVRELVEQENRNPMRGEGHANALTRIPLDSGAREALGKQGLDFDAVPAQGRTVQLRGNANLSTGGTAEDVTDRLHPQTAQACVRAARAIGLDVAGIDLVCKDTAHTLHEQHGAIIEINAAPGIRMHEHPSRGIPRRAGSAIVDSLFPVEQDDGRIPTIAVTGTNGKTTTTLAIASVMRMSGYRTGVTTTEGVFVGDEVLKRGDCTGYWSARMLLSAPDVEAAVLETARGGILKRGLAFDRCDVGVVLNVQGDHLGLDGVETLEDLAHLKGLVARTARRAAVLNADDALCVKMAKTVAEGVDVVYFTMQADNAVVQRHLANAGRAVMLRGAAIVLAEGERRTPVVDADRLPFTLNGLARHNVANALACAAATWAIGLTREKICEGLSGFQSTEAANPLRLNLFRARGTTVLIDYAHNPAAYRAMIATGRQLTRGRLVGVIAAPGDRRDPELLEVGRACSEGFDALIVYEMRDRRGRPVGETARLVADGALQGGIAAERLQVVPDLRQALIDGLALCGPQDLLLHGCASHVSDLHEAVPEGVQELVVLERRRAHLAPYADGHSVDRPTQSKPAPGWNPSMPDRRKRQPQSLPYIVPAQELEAA